MIKNKSNFTLDIWVDKFELDVLLSFEEVQFTWIFSKWMARFHEVDSIEIKFNNMGWGGVKYKWLGSNVYVNILAFLVTLCRYSTKRLNFDAKIPNITAISNFNMFFFFINHLLSWYIITYQDIYDSENNILPDESRCE